MPPPSLSTTTTTRSMPRPAAPSRPLVSWRKATSPMQERRGPVAVRQGQPDRRGHDAVDAVGAPVGVHLHAGARAGRTTRGRGSASTTTPPGWPPVGQGRDHRRARRRARSARPRRRARASIARLRRSPELLPARRPRAAVDRLHAVRARPPTRRAAPRAPAAATTAAVPCGSSHAPSPATTISAAPTAASHSPATRDASGRAEADDRPRAGGRRRVAQQGVDAPGSRPGMPHTAACGAASTGQPRAAATRPSAGPGPEPAPGHDHARAGRRGRRRRLIVGVAARRRRRAPGPRAVGARPGRSGPASPTSGSRKARLRWTGPGRGPVASA